MGNCGWKINVKNVEHDSLYRSETCRICLGDLSLSERMDGVTVRTRCCNNLVHKKCFKEWNISESICPNCSLNKLIPIKKKTLNNIYSIVERELNLVDQKIVGIEATIYVDNR